MAAMGRRNASPFLPATLHLDGMVQISRGETRHTFCICSGMVLNPQHLCNQTPKCGEQPPQRPQSARFNGVAQSDNERLVKLGEFCCGVIVFGGRKEESKRLNEPDLLDLNSMLEWCGLKLAQVAFTKLGLTLARMRKDSLQNLRVWWSKCGDEAPSRVFFCGPQPDDTVQSSETTAFTNWGWL
jgi:hypothetical protein